jgi:hypothetical protein
MPELLDEDISQSQNRDWFPLFWSAFEFILIRAHELGLWP